MRISYSHIAWEPADEAAAAEILRDAGLDAVDVAPARYFPDPATATRADAERVRDWWRSYGIEVLGMQALLFGTKGLNLFGSPESRQSMLDRLATVCRLAGWMGARRLVFGSPKNRDRGALTRDQALEVAIPFFRALGQRATDHGVLFCLEPNPPRYACNFMITTEEGAEVVRAVGHPGIRLHLDAGTIAINGEDPEIVVSRYADLVGYIHISEPDLLPIAGERQLHQNFANALQTWLPTLPVSIEMKSAGIEHLSVIATKVISVYGGKRGMKHTHG